MLIILVAGMVSELVMLPSMLFGPIGRVFDAKKKTPAGGEAGALTPSTAGVDGSPHMHDPAASSERSHAGREPQTSGYRRQA
jgi:hypothetical protein